jgi:dUTP pyrophosphatase
MLSFVSSIFPFHPRYKRVAKIRYFLTMADTENDQPMVLKIFRINKNNPLPCYMTEGASGIDLMASVQEAVRIDPGDYKRIPSGIVIALPKGYEAQIRPRSGLAFRDGVTVLNAPGTIDADYRGEVSVLLINHGSRPFSVTNGMRIAQMIVTPVARADIVEALHLEELERTDRDRGGFGHTGV